MAANLILVRHAAPTVDPATPPPEWTLSDGGRTAAAALADRLAAFAPQAAVSSPEPKARETAQIIASRLGIPIATDGGFAEHRRPALPFSDRDELHARMRAFFADPTQPFFGGESGAEALARFEVALTRHPERPLLVASHGTVLSLYLATRLGMDPYPLWASLALPDAFVLGADGALIARLS